MIAQIKYRFSKIVKLEGDFTSLRSFVEEVVKSGESLSGVDLFQADLYEASLSGAYLYQADLRRANLSKANLSHANLNGADLSRSNLTGANLTNAGLDDAQLQDANLYGAIWKEGVILNRGPAKEVKRSDGLMFRLLDSTSGWFVDASGWITEDKSKAIIRKSDTLTMDEAWQHFVYGELAGTPLGEESEDILVMFRNHIERLIRLK